LALTRSAAYTVLLQRVHFSPPPPNRPNDEERMILEPERGAGEAVAGASGLCGVAAALPLLLSLRRGVEGGDRSDSVLTVRVPPDVLSACMKCGLHHSPPHGSMHQDDSVSFTLHSLHRKHATWKILSCATALSATYTVLAQSAHFSPPPP